MFVSVLVRVAVEYWWFRLNRLWADLRVVPEAPVMPTSPVPPLKICTLTPGRKGTEEFRGTVTVVVEAEDISIDPLESDRANV